MGKKILTLDQIEKKRQASLEPVVVYVPDWGGNVLVRPLSLQDINECTQKAANPVRGGEINTNVRNGWYLVTSMVEPVITLADAEKWLTETSAGPVTVILAEVLRLSGMTESAKDDAKSDADEESAAPLPDGPGGETGDDAQPT